MGRLFGTDGVRGLANADLTPELRPRRRGVGRARAVGAGPAAPGGPWSSGRDGRASGEMLEAAVTAGLTSAGADVLRAGVLPTPAIAHLVAELERRLRRGAVRQPQPDAGQRDQAVRPRRAQARRRASRTRSRPAIGESWTRPTGAGVGRARDLPDAAERYAELPARHAAAQAGRAAARRRLRARRGLRGRPGGADPGRRRGHRDRGRAGRREHQRRRRLDPPVRSGRRGPADRRRRGHRVRRGRRPLPGRVRRRRGRRRRRDPRHLRARAAGAGPAEVRHGRGHRDEQPRPAPRDARRRHPAAHHPGRRPVRAGGDAGRRTCPSAASRAGTSCSPTGPPPATGCSPRCSCSAGWPAPARRWPSWPRWCSGCRRCSSTCRWRTGPGWPTAPAVVAAVGRGRRPSSATTGRVLLRPSGTEQIVRVMVEAPGPRASPQQTPIASRRVGRRAEVPPRPAGVPGRVRGGAPDAWHVARP